MQPSFESLSDALVAVIGELGYSRPTPIQIEAIPALLASRDVVGQSQTGSGKTARPQKDALERGVHVAIGTPGRLLDHLRHGSLNPTTIMAVAAGSDRALMRV